MTNNNRSIDTMPKATEPQTVEDAFRCIDLVLSNQQSDWQGLTDALLEQSETSIIDTISISCFDENDHDCPPSEEVMSCFEAMGTALHTSLGMATLQIKTYQEMPLTLLRCILKNSGRLDTLSIESHVTFSTTELTQDEPKRSAADATIIDNLQIDFSESLVNLPNLFSDHGIIFESLEIRMQYDSSDTENQRGTFASLRAKGGKHFPAELLCSAVQRTNSESSLIVDKVEDEMEEDQSRRMESPSVLSHPANIISPLSAVPKNEQADTSTMTPSVPPLTSLSLKLAGVPSEEALLDVAKVLSKNTTLTSFHLKWDHSQQSRTRSRASVISCRNSVLQAFENVLEKNFFLEDLQIGLWNLTPKIKHYLSLNHGKKRRFLTKDYNDITQEDWVDALVKSQDRKRNDMSLDMNPYASSSQGVDKQECMCLSSVYYFVRGNPALIR